MMGDRPETMSRAIGKFQEESLAHFSWHIVNVLNVETLLDAIGLEH